MHPGAVPTEKCIQCSEISCELRGLRNSSEQERGAHRSEACAGALQAQRKRPIAIAEEDVFLATWADNDVFCRSEIAEAQVGGGSTSRAAAIRLDERSGGACEPAEGRFGSRQSRVDKGVETPRRRAQGAATDAGDAMPTSQPTRPV